MSIGSISIGKRKCLLVGGGRSNKTRVELKFRVSKKYRLMFLMDGKPFGGYQWTVNKRYKYNKTTKSKEEIDTVVYVDVPSDGRNHSIALKDIATSEKSSDTSLTSIGCEGGVVPTVESLTEDPATGEKKYTISLYHDARVNKNLTGYVYLNGALVGSAIPLKPRQKAFRDVVVPATGQDYTISTAYTYGKTWARQTMWFVVESNDPPVTDPVTWTSVTSFDAGETVVVTSAVGEEPLATDGSEWILLEYAPHGTTNWNFIEDGGLVEPSSDGTWSYQIDTGTGTPFLISTSWDIRARRYRDYVESETVIHNFTITNITYIPPGTPVPAPKLLSPVNKTAKGGTRVYLSGTGVAGARLTFRRRLLTDWGTQGPVPATCTVGKDGKWKTWVMADKIGVHSYKRIAYSCRATVNGRTSAWSNEQTVRWVK